MTKAEKDNQPRNTGKKRKRGMNGQWVNEDWIYKIKERRRARGIKIGGLLPRI